MQLLGALSFRFPNACWRSAIRFRTASIAVLIGAATLTATQAGPDTRSLRLYHLHTGQHITITFKQNGRYIPEALSRLDDFVGDWRQKKSVKMDPVLYDLLWTVYQDSGAIGEIDIVCGYRAPETNNMLRRRSKGVAKNSQHVRGKAVDFFIPGVPLETLRTVGLRLQIGGIGYYPASGSPFVHMDTGSVRHWPRMTREQLVRVFPNGHTLHVPSDGKPLPGYEQALAEYRARGSVSSGVMLASATVRDSTAATAGSSVALAAIAGNRGFPAPAAGSERGLVRTASVKAEPVQRPVVTALAVDEDESDDAATVAETVATPADVAEPVALAPTAPMPRPAIRAIETALLAPDATVVATSGTASRRYMLVGKATPGKSIAQRLAAGFGTDDPPVPAQEPERPARVMAFASSTDTVDRDPLHIMQREGRAAAAPPPRPVREAEVAPEITASISPVEPVSVAQTWRDPMAKLVFAAPEADWGRTLWTVNTSTRQKVFAELMMPDPEGDPSILQTPDRVVAGGFSGKPYEGLRTDHFAGVVRPVTTIDLSEPRRFASLVD